MVAYTDETRCSSFHLYRPPFTTTFGIIDAIKTLCLRMDLFVLLRNVEGVIIAYSTGWVP